MRGTNDWETTAGCIDTLTDMMPTELSRRQAERILFLLEVMAQEVKISVVDWSDSSEDSDEQGDDGR